MSQINLAHACRVCHSVDNTGSCGKCYKAFYCKDTNCQHLDWKYHKRFCSLDDEKKFRGGQEAESIELATLRRDLCLALLKLNANNIASFLIQQRCAQKPGCLIVRPNHNSTFVAGTRFMQMCDSLNISVHPLVQTELVWEIGRAAHHTAIPILLSDVVGTSCYVVSYSGLDHFKAIADAIPSPVLDLIFYHYVQFARNFLSPEELEFVKHLAIQESRKIAESSKSDVNANSDSDDD